MTDFQTSRLKGIIIGLGFILAQLTISLYLPTLPTLEATFHVSHQAMLETITFLLLGYGIGQLTWGTLSDYYGRRPVMLCALLSYGILVIGVSFTRHLGFFSLLLSAAGFFIAATTSVGNALLRDVYGKARAAKVIANVGIVMASGPVIAPLIGAHLLYWYGWQSVFLFLFVLATLLLFGVLWLGETHHQRGVAKKESHHITAIYKERLSNLRFIGFIVTLGLISGCLFSFIGVAPFIFTHFYHMTLQTFGGVFLGASASYVLSTAIYSRLAKRIKPRQCMTLGTLLTFLGSIGLSVIAYAHQQQVWLLVLMTAITMSGFGFALPSCKVGAMTIFQQHNGSTASLMKAFQVFLSVMITLVAAHLYHPQSFFYLALFYALLAGSALVLQWMCWRISSLVQRDEICC